MRELDAHLVVVGSGVAGLYAALLAAEAGVHVTLLTKGRLAQSNTHFAQGGICAVLDSEDAAPGDTVEAHIADTLKAGAGQCDPEAVQILCEQAASEIAALERFGVVFDADPVTGRRALGLEGAHSAARILHAGGDATGAAIADGLIGAVRKAASSGTVTIIEDAFVHELLRGYNSVRGVAYQRHFPADGQHEASNIMELQADGVLLATGGAGQLFDSTTNPSVATADGVALAWRAGAVVADLEYFQFHPTAMVGGANFLISEAVRGAGAVLRDADGEAFMVSYHPDGDLAPRDVVSRSIAAHLRNGRSGQHVFLDATGVEAIHGAGYLARRFPTIDATTQELGFDWTREWLPVAPAAHYWMGGIATSVDAQTSLDGLYAAGEVACTGVHGANRLASNSLLEGLVFGRRAVDAFMVQAMTAESYTGAPNTQIPWHRPGIEAASLRRIPAEPNDHDGPGTGGTGTGTGAGAHVPSFSKEALGQLMGAYAGVVRDDAGLQYAASVLGAWRSQQEARHPTGIAPTRQSAEALNLLTVAELLVHAALARRNSVGAHFRSDFPETGDFPTTTVNAATNSRRSSNFWVASAPIRHQSRAYHSTSHQHDFTNFPVLESESA
ncbi:L-aspartate oxidase [Arthrobacter sp. GMC3]|uniref:L-aspartate oxidase n=1 Tax=Arthrobacter sp. GMC3 TaxID=2058894 RepID=UPI000CE4939B|nr:FAD-binding protein [Arthrobacter sp. GMC3]